jgi:hypothetical protein
MLHGEHARIKDEESHHKCAMDVSTATGEKAIGSGRSVCADGPFFSLCGSIFKVAWVCHVEHRVANAYTQGDTSGRNIVRGERLQASAIGMLSAIHTVQRASARLVHASASQEDALMRINQVCSLKVRVCVSV